jgi:hypothetical protein
MTAHGSPDAATPATANRTGQPIVASPLFFMARSRAQTAVRRRGRPRPSVFAESLAAGTTGDAAFIAGEAGRPMAKESFGEWFREVCAKAGRFGSAHDLCKALATKLAAAAAASSRRARRAARAAHPCGRGFARTLAKTWRVAGAPFSADSPVSVQS